MKTRLISAILTCLMLVSLLPLSSCGSEQTPELSRVTHVYKSTDIALPEDIFSSFKAGGSGVVSLGSRYDENTQSQTFCLLDLDITTGEYTTIDFTAPNDEYFHGFSVGSDGRPMMIAETYNEDYSEAKSHIFTLDGDKAVMLLEDAGSYFESTGEDSLYGGMRGGIYINSFATDSEGNIYLACDFAIVVLDKDGKKRFEIETKGYIDTVASDSNGRVYSKYRDENHDMKIAYIDLEKRDFGESLALPTSNDFLNADIYVGPGYDFYLKTDGGLYGYNASDAEPTELCNWINSDIIESGVRDIIVLDKDNFVVYYYEYISEEEGSLSELYLMKHVPDEEVPERYVIDLATYGSNGSGELESTIVRFNRNNDEYRVRIKDYSLYATEEDWQYGQTVLEQEILAGETPDIIIASDFDKSDAWADNGSFADIYKFMDASDSTLKRDAFIEGILDKLAIDGKLYTLPERVTLTSLVGKANNVPDGWDANEFIEFVTSMDEGQFLMLSLTPQMLLRYALQGSLGSFVDYDNTTCSFDSEEFKKLLAFAAELPEMLSYADSISGDELADFQQNRRAPLREDKVLLDSAHIMDVTEYISKSIAFGGEEVSFVGYPVTEGNGAMLQLQSSYAIFEKSPVKDGAWAYLSSLLTGDTPNMRGHHTGFSLIKSAFEAENAEQLDYHYFFRLDGSGWSGWSGEMTEERRKQYESRTDGVLRDVTQDDIDALYEFLKDASAQPRGFDDIFALITEEFDLLYAGEKSVDETAKVIQDRVSLYVAEHY